MIDAGCRVDPGELRRLFLAQLALHVFEVADSRIGALGVVGHVLENHELAAARAEVAQIRIGRIHQSRHLEQALLVILGLVCRDVELRVACKDILDAARTIDPGNAVGRRRRRGRRRLAEPPGDPAAGRTEGRRVFARDAPARIIIKVVLQREGKLVCRMQRLDRRNLRLGQALVAALARRATQ